MKNLHFLLLLILCFSCGENQPTSETTPEKESLVAAPNTAENTSASKQTAEDKSRPTLTIIGNDIWVRDRPGDGEVILKLADGTICEVVTKNEQATIRGVTDYWYKIRQGGKVGYVFGSQTSLRQSDRQFAQPVVESQPPAGNYAFPPEMLYQSRIPARIKSGVPAYGMFNHYAIGWSSDGKFAYVANPNDAEIMLRVVVQNMRTDEIAWSQDYFSDEQPGADHSARGLWQSNISAISNNLRAQGIIPLSDTDVFGQFPAQIRLADGTMANYTTNAQEVRRPSEYENADEVGRRTLRVTKNGSQAKIVSVENYRPISFIQGTAVVGYYRSPFEDRIAICEVRSGRGFEGLNMYVSMIGCDLNAF